MPETRIALIMGGGVSLGTFSGGALAQVIKLLKHVKRGPAKIDVVSGASAGSMTLGVVIYHLMKGSSDQEIEEALHEAWVKRISIDNLYPKDISRHKTPSLFSNEIIEDIASSIINTDQWSGSDEPHPLFADGMKVSFSLTNLNGIPVRSEGQIIRQPSAGGGTATGKNSVFADAVQTTFHQDNIRFIVRRSSDSEKSFESVYHVLRPWKSDEAQKKWDFFRNGAIASGAFPGAFPPGRILREKHEFGRWWPDDLDHIDTFLFDYLDGGILRNEPLKEAIRMAAEQDEGMDVERVFIFIDPNVSGTNEVYPLSFNMPISLKEQYDRTGRLRSTELSTPDYMSKLMGVFGRFAGVLASQATFRDWLKAAHYNSIVEWRDDLIKLFDEVQPKPGSEIEKNLDNLLETIYRDKWVRSKGESEGDVDMTAVKQSIQKELEKRHEETGRGDLFTTKLKLAIDLVANLRNKRKLNMVAITPASQEGDADHPIAGNFLRSFGGFFKEEYRQHDFEVGKHLAAKVLNASIGSAKPLLKEAAEIPDAPEPFDPEPHYRELDNLRRARFEKLIEEHLYSTLPVPGIIRGYVGRKIRDKISHSLLSGIDGQVQYIYIRFENVEDRRYLKGSTGDDNHVKSNGIIETVIGIRKRREGNIQYRMFGPELHEDEKGTFYFEVYRNRRIPFRSGEKQGRITLEGNPEEWYKTVCRCSCPCIIRDMSSDDRFRPIDLKSVNTDLA
jgi:predicted acylesterase/phospholipase RssA